MKVGMLHGKAVSAPILVCPDFSQPFVVETDYLNYVLGEGQVQKQATYSNETGTEMFHHEEGMYGGYYCYREVET